MQRLAYSVAQAKEQLPISRSKIYKLIASGELHAVHVGSRLLISHDELVNFLARSQQATGRKPADARE